FFPSTPSLFLSLLYLSIPIFCSYTCSISPSLHLFLSLISPSLFISLSISLSLSPLRSISLHLSQALNSPTSNRLSVHKFQPPQLPKILGNMLPWTWSHFSRWIQAVFYRPW